MNSCAHALYVVAKRFSVLCHMPPYLYQSSHIRSLPLGYVYVYGVEWLHHRHNLLTLSIIHLIMGPRGVAPKACVRADIPPEELRGDARI